MANLGGCIEGRVGLSLDCRGEGDRHTCVGMANLGGCIEGRVGLSLVCREGRVTGIHV